MTTTLLIGVAAMLVIATVSAFERRFQIAGPLLLVALGLALSWVGVTPDLELDPEWVLQGVLPPLLYAAAVSMPTMSFRRELRPISGLSITLVVGTSVMVGLLFAWLLPDVGFVWGVALGAIISPTDAVATSIVKRTNVSRRVLTILEGESLLNDASALVLLRAAIVAGAGTFSVWGVIGSFIWSLLIAVVIGVLVGRFNLTVRGRIADPTLNTILSFTVPFIASIPAEMLNASGLVAAVIAGLVTGTHAPRLLPPRHRLSDAQNWASVQLVLESAVFLTMGLQLSDILQRVHTEYIGAWEATAIASAALVAVLMIRAVFVIVLLRSQARRARHHAQIQPHVAAVQNTLLGKIDSLTPPALPPRKSDSWITRNLRRGKRIRHTDPDQFATRVSRFAADLEYFLRQPLQARDGVVVVWAGMRGAVTVAAAQTLPAETPHRPLLVFIAFAVAVISLLIQGASVQALARRLYGARKGTESPEHRRQREQLRARLQAVGAAASPTTTSRQRKLRLAELDAQRRLILAERDIGAFDPAVLAQALREVDAEQIAWELRSEHLDELE